MSIIRTASCSLLIIAPPTVSGCSLHVASPAKNKQLSTGLPNISELSNLLYKNSLDGTQAVTREALLREMFFTTKTSAGRLHMAKQLLGLPLGKLKSFAGSKEGLIILNSWILDSMGNEGWYPTLATLCVFLCAFQLICFLYAC